MGFLKAIAWALMKRLIHRQFPNVPSLSTQRLAAWFAQAGMNRPLVLDARTPKEYEVSHLLDANLAPSDLNELSHWTNLTHSTPIVTYCSVGYRSARLAQQLQDMGYKNVFNLEGSIFEWVNEGHPVYQGTQAVKQVHPFNDVWGLLLNPDSHCSKSD
ncbi:rhodanese-like domain-containing protein [Myxacorys almedinensis]|uniref:Rhodanese-like domain-containing protein n=1 Tax=Myxacorys almedinensis A TaxID=2690445 RepID=A0A8J7Z4Q6_9CYAN|nr:rhodanese-like domain-containing protein [Myxacorys almedinensis]NDJ17816.1 rhodanese-like domain-containing protein [Myxacorys almedinensis A]